MQYLHTSMECYIKGLELVKVLQNIEGVLPVHRILNIGVGVSWVEVSILVSRYTGR